MSEQHENCVIGLLKSTPLVATFIAFVGITLFNASELLLTVFVTFTHYRSTYFYSLLVAIIGVFIYETFVLILFATARDGDTFNVGTNVGILVGWTCMVTGHSFVLWSRLHLVLDDARKLKWLRNTILFNGVIMHVYQSTVTLVAAANNGTDQSDQAFMTGEKVEVVIFAIQEFVLSSLYMVEAWRLLKLKMILPRPGDQRTMKRLIVANIIIILMDFSLLCLEFLALWGVWCSYKGMIYSMKLKIEFWILGQLKDFTKGPPMSTFGEHDHGNKSDSTGEAFRTHSHPNSTNWSNKNCRCNEVASAVGNASTGGESIQDGILKTAVITTKSSREYPGIVGGIGNARDESAGEECPDDSEIDLNGDVHVRPGKP